MHAVPHKQRRSFRARNLSPRWMASHLQQWDEGANAIVAPCSNIPGPDGCLSDPKASRTIQMRWSRKPNNCSKVSLLKASRMTVSNRRRVPQKAYPLLAAKRPLPDSPLLGSLMQEADFRVTTPLRTFTGRVMASIQDACCRSSSFPVLRNQAVVAVEPGPQSRRSPSEERRPLFGRCCR